MKSFSFRMLGVCMAVFFIYAKMASEREMIVKFKQGVSQSRVEAIGKENKFVFVKRLAGLENSYVCRVEEDQKMSLVINLLNQNPDIDYAEANQKVEVLNTVAVDSGSARESSSAVLAVQELTIRDPKDRSLTNQ